MFIERNEECQGTTSWLDNVVTNFKLAQGVLSFCLFWIVVVIFAPVSVGLRLVRGGLRVEAVSDTQVRKLVPLRDMCIRCSRWAFSFFRANNDGRWSRVSQQKHSGILSQCASRIFVVMKFGAGVGEDIFAEVKNSFTELINKLLSKVSSKASQKSCCDHEFAKVNEKKTDFEFQVASLRQLFWSPALWAVSLQSCRLILGLCQDSNWKWTRCVLLNARSLYRIQHCTNGVSWEVGVEHHVFFRHFLVPWHGFRIFLGPRQIPEGTRLGRCWKTRFVLCSMFCRKWCCCVCELVFKPNRCRVTWDCWNFATLCVC